MMEVLSVVEPLESGTIPSNAFIRFHIRTRLSDLQDAKPILASVWGHPFDREIPTE